VKSTKSVNMTVKWRRSPSMWRLARDCRAMAECLPGFCPRLLLSRESYTRAMRLDLTV
jgi:hypothetical protein